jgi:hypothetical protein
MGPGGGDGPSVWQHTAGIDNTAQVKVFHRGAKAAEGMVEDVTTMLGKNPAAVIKLMGADDGEAVALTAVQNEKLMGAIGKRVSGKDDSTAE